MDLLGSGNVKKIVIISLVATFFVGSFFAYDYAAKKAKGVTLAIQSLNGKKWFEIFDFTALQRPSGTYFSSGDLIVGADKKFKIKKDVIDSENIKNKSIKNEDIETSAIDARTIKDASISASDLQKNSIGSAEIKDDSITGLDISSNADLNIGSISFGNNSISKGSFNGDWNFNNGVLTNIGNSGTDFTSNGGLNLAGDFKVDGNAFFVDSRNGFVGIGTNNPSEKLDIHNGLISIGDGMDITQKLITVNSGHDVVDPVFEYTSAVFNIDGMDGLTYTNGLEQGGAEDAFFRVKSVDANATLIAQTTGYSSTAKIIAMHNPADDLTDISNAHQFIMSTGAGDNGMKGRLQFQYGINEPTDVMVVTPMNEFSNEVKSINFPNVNVGIGIDDPQQKLSVNGDIGIGEGNHTTIPLIKAYAGHSVRDLEISYVPGLFGINKLDGLTVTNAARLSGGENGFLRMKSIEADASIMSETTNSNKSASFTALYNPASDDNQSFTGNRFSMIMNSGAGKEGKLQYQFGAYTPVDAMIVAPTTATTNDISKVLFPNGNMAIGAADPGAYKLYINGSGYLNDSAWTYASDRRLKKNIEELGLGLSTIEKLNPVKFDYRDGRKNQYGFIAQEVQTILPDLVEKRPDGMLGLRSDAILPIAVNAIKEQQVQIKDLQETVGKITDDAKKSSGDDKISAGETSVSVKTNRVKKDSRIFVTIASKIKTNTSLMVTDVKDGESFKVEIVDPLDDDLKFNWWIVDAQ